MQRDCKRTAMHSLAALGKHGADCYGFRAKIERTLSMNDAKASASGPAPPVTDAEVMAFYRRTGGLQNSTEVVQLYSDWADTYEASVNHFARYLIPARIAELVLAHCRAPESVILDAACGTGLTGMELAARGWKNLYGIDISQPMLAHAAQKQCYRELKRGNLYQPLPFPGAFFDAVVCAGAFCPGHLKARALRPMLEVLKPGGVLICDVERNSWGRAGNMAMTFSALIARGEISEFWLKEAHFYEADPGERSHGYYVVAWKGHGS